MGNSTAIYAVLSYSYIPPLTGAKVSTRCQCCHYPYKVDFEIPDELWELIKPAGALPGAGLLCGHCLVDRLERLVGSSAFRLKRI